MADVVCCARANQGYNLEGGAVPIAVLSELCGRERPLGLPSHVSKAPLRHAEVPIQERIAIPTATLQRLLPEQGDQG